MDTDNDLPTTDPANATMTDSQIARTIEHSKFMLNCEEENVKLFEQRSRIIQSIAIALIAFTGLAIFRIDLTPDGILTIDLWKRIAVLTAVGAPLITGVVLLFACIANELRHGEDHFDYGARPFSEPPPSPQATWDDVSIFYGIGEAFDIFRKVARSKRIKKKEINRIIDEMKETPDSLLNSHCDSDYWHLPRPNVRRLTKASFYLQFPSSEALKLYNNIRTSSPSDALIYKSQYLSASCLRRWNQRRVDELRLSERLLIQGVAMLAVSFCAMVVFMLAAIEGYPTLVVVTAGVILVLTSWLYKERTASRDRNHFVTAFEELSTDSLEDSANTEVQINKPGSGNEKVAAMTQHNSSSSYTD